MRRILDRRAAPRFVILVALSALACALPAGAQLPPRLERCLPYPTLAQEIQAMRAQAPKRTVGIADVKLEGQTKLSSSVLEQLTASLMEREWDGDSDWLEAVRYEILGAWQDRGYFKAEVSLQMQVLQAEELHAKVALSIRMDEGQQYSLSEIRIENAQAFPPEELRKLIPLQEGEIFDVGKIRDGLNAMQKLYASEGYVDFTVQLETDVDDRLRQISLTLEMDEQKRFYVEGIEVLGLDEEKKSRLKWKLKVGDPLNSTFVEDFLQDNKELLPADASYLDVQMRRHPRTGQVFLTFDFRGCPVVD